jgi:hypothetical protein
MAALRLAAQRRYDKRRCDDKLHNEDNGALQFAEEVSGASPSHISG